MIVEELERKFFELKGKLDVGVVTEEQFKSEVEKLRFQDNQNRWWMLGAQSGKWYSYDGTRWIPGQPPRDVVPPASATSKPVAQEPPSQVAPIVPTPTVVAPPIVESLTIVPSTLPAQPGKAAPLKPVVPPPQPEHVKPTPLAPKMKTSAPIKPVNLPRLPIPGWLLVVAAASVALVAVVIFWILIENFVPGKPISSFINNLTGTKPVAPLGSPTVISSPSSGTSKDVPTLIALGDQLVLQSQMDAAITQYQTAVQLAPASAVPLTRWARALAFKGQMQDAVNKAQLAVQRAPSDAEANAQFCRALVWNGQVGDGIAICVKATQLDPQNVNALAFLAEAYLLAQRTVDAQAYAQTALQLAPQSVEAHHAQAWLLTVQGQKDAALAEWRQTVALEPSFYFRHFEYGEVLRVYYNNPVDAITEYKTAMTLYGAYVPSINRLGLALLATNKPQEAIPQFQRALTLDSGNVDNFTYLGIAFGQANQCSQAMPYLEQALRLNPDNTVAQKGLSDCKSGKPPTLAPTAPPTVPLTPPIIAPKP
jgi:tetratricopeptide (TPR) repeat protein